MKRPRKVALISIYDYPRQDYSAYWAIQVAGDDKEGYRWAAQILSYEPVAWEYKGTRTVDRPDVPRLAYPSDAHLMRELAYNTIPDTPPGNRARLQAAERVRQDAFRAECARIYEASPKAVHVVFETIGVTETRDKADTAAQTWVLDQMQNFRRAVVLEPLTDEDVAALVVAFDAARLAKDFGAVDRIRGRLKSSAIKIKEPKNIDATVATKWERGYALALGGPFGMLVGLGYAIAGKLFDLVLMAIAYSTTVRNNRMVQVRDAIDGGAGAGLMRIFDGARPATCGAATTLLAELTHSDPCAGAPASGVLTFSAITADASANATGTATWYRDVDSTGTCCVDGSVGTAGSDLNLNSTSISVGQQVSCTSKVYTEGSA